MNKISFAIALHFHQPIGNFGNVLERACRFCYKPFLQILSDYPDLKMMFHVSGCLLDYLESRHPEIIKLIHKMCSRNQIEIMGGGYYEPVLTSISSQDALGQVKMMSEYIKKRFDFKPKGMWVAERVWHPQLAGLIYKGGMRYIILDDEHLLRAGVNQSDMQGYFLTGEGKEKIAVFPSDKKLRYLIPFKLPQETVDYLGSMAEKKKNVLLTYGDDGEKFGEWPGTYEWVFEKKWLNNFFDILQRNNSWIKLVHFSEYIKNHKPSGTLTVPEGSYTEMMEWAGGSWMNFLSKYPEANQMHKKMSYVSAKISETENLEGVDKKNEILRAAVKQLYMGQCNCSYWHGVFGGLYLYHLRSAIYSHLIEADKILDRILHKNSQSWTNIFDVDYDSDGKEEIVMESKNFSLYIDPSEGGILKELDCKLYSFNLLNVLSRRKEDYHKKIIDAVPKANNGNVATIHDDFRSVDPAYKSMLIYDKYDRYSLRSYFVKGNPSVECFAASLFEEVGGFAGGDYEFNQKNKSVFLSRANRVVDSLVRIKKQVKIVSDKEIEFICSVKNEKPISSKLSFVIEFNLTMPYLNSERYSYACDGEIKNNLDASGECFPLSSFCILDSSGEVSVDFDVSDNLPRVIYFPVKTVSQSERAYELNYQCSCILFIWGSGLSQEGESLSNISLFINR